MRLRFYDIEISGGAAMQTTTRRGKDGELMIFTNLGRGVTVMGGGYAASFLIDEFCRLPQFVDVARECFPERFPKSGTLRLGQGDYGP